MPASGRGPTAPRPAAELFAQRLHSGYTPEIGYTPEMFSRPGVYRAPMRSRRDEIDFGATIERARARGLCGFGDPKEPSDDRLARRIARFRKVEKVRSSGPVTRTGCTGSAASRDRITLTPTRGRWPSTWFMFVNAIGCQLHCLSQPCQQPSSPPSAAAAATSSRPTIPPSSTRASSSGEKERARRGISRSR